MVCLSISVCILLLNLWLNAQEASTLTIQDFFPFGIEYSDAALPQVDDVVRSISLPTELPFFGKVYSTVGISTNGLLSLNSTVNDFTPRVFPTNGVLIAPFWADVDTRGIGSIYYRLTSNQTLLNRFSMDISSFFVGQVTFSPQILFIATWFEVGYYNTHTDKNNTFQCVLATNGESSFVVFLYREGGIQWTTGDANKGMNGLGGDPATVGFNAGDNNMNFALVTGSNTDAVINISSTSNVGIPGKWAFKVNNATVTAPDPCLSNPCDQNADCVQIGLSSDFMCTCVPPYSGNGTLCTIPDPCLFQPCDSNALCERDGVLNENFTCTCLSPFVGNGFNCTIPDPCRALPCDRNAVCTREGLLSGNFTCECQPPYTVGNGFECSFPDPCLSQPCDSNAVCEREGLLNDNFFCTCLAPFTIGDGFNCSIPDPCLSAPCGPNADCEREGPLTNAFNCSCRSPFIMEDSLLGCIIPDPCLSAPCHVNASCVRESVLSEGLTCTCLPGFAGDGYSCTPLQENENSSLSLFQQHKTVIVIVLSFLGVIVLILLIGAMYGYISISRIMYKRIRFDSQTEVNKDSEL